MGGERKQESGHKSPGTSGVVRGRWRRDAWEMESSGASRWLALARVCGQLALGHTEWKFWMKCTSRENISSLHSVVVLWLEGPS